MSPVHLRNLGIPRNQPKDREGLSRTRRPGRGHLGHSDGWQDIEGNHTPFAIHFPTQQKPQNRGLEGYRSSSSAPPNPQRPFSMDHGQKEVVQTFGGEGNQDKGESSHYQSNRRTADPDRAYSDSFRLTRSRFQKKTRIQGQKQDLFQPKAERVRPNDPEAVVICERSTQEPQIAVNTSIISSHNNRTITPTQNEHNVATPESNLNSEEMWLKMSQFAEKTQKQFEELQESHERMKTLTAFMDKIVRPLQEGHSQLRKASEETNKTMNQVFEEQNHCKRDRDFLY
ncbi:hypothetical protein O181_053404 [Austropuccinia psidii MF-1]|uniref:Uncharacterized protein n=1 Tax=Austropuccinia psidii MF-1 TaxID=1389203 RepID=A0A9Q3E2J7_9BASI|nr:hypothetical protein [Austropuccinia psidii MF-1]